MTNQKRDNGAHQNISPSTVIIVNCQKMTLLNVVTHTNMGVIRAFEKKRESERECDVLQPCPTRYSCVLLCRWFLQEWVQSCLSLQLSELWRTCSGRWLLPEDPHCNIVWQNIKYIIQFQRNKTAIVITLKIRDLYTAAVVNTLLNILKFFVYSFPNWSVLIPTHQQVYTTATKWGGWSLAHSIWSNVYRHLTLIHIGGSLKMLPPNLEAINYI